MGHTSQGAHRSQQEAVILRTPQFTRFAPTAFETRLGDETLSLFFSLIDCKINKIINIRPVSVK